METALENASVLLSASSAGNLPARERLTALVYDELRRLARNQLRRERPGHTLQATALVHEAYLRLVGQSQVPWQNREHFIGVAAQMMRRVLADHARGRRRIKRGGDPRRMPVSVLGRLQTEAILDFSALDDALKELEALDARKGRIVELRYFGGLSIQEVASLLEISTATVEREWRFARAFLQRALGDHAQAPG